MDSLPSIPDWMKVTGALLVMLLVVEYFVRENEKALIRRIAGIFQMMLGFYIAFQVSLFGQPEQFRAEELTLLKTRLENMENSLPRWHGNTARHAGILKKSIACSCPDQIKAQCSQREANDQCPTFSEVRLALDAVSEAPKNISERIDKILEINLIDTLAMSFVEQFEAQNFNLKYRFIPVIKDFRDRSYQDAEPMVFFDLVVGSTRPSDTIVADLLDFTAELVVHACILRGALEKGEDVATVYQETFEQEALVQSEYQEETIEGLKHNTINETFLQQRECLPIDSQEKNSLQKS